MARKNPLKILSKRINSEILKLSWIYIIAFSLLALLGIQLYASTTRSAHNQNITAAEKLQQLQDQVDDQAAQIKLLQDEINNLKNK